MENLANSIDTHDFGCECYFNTTEIKQWRWKEDPPECLQRCKVQFMRGVLGGWQEGPGWVDGCRTLNTAMPIHDFWSLYWCDSTFCGVGIDQAGGVGQDPNVDLIINTCHNIGFYSIIDPGPPPPGFKCHTELDAPESCRLFLSPAPTPSSSISWHQTSTSTGSLAASGTAASSTHTSAGSAVTTSSTTEGPSTASGSDLSMGAKVGLAVSGAIIAIVLLSFALFYFRRRESKYRALRRILGLPITPSDDPPVGSSPSPLIPPLNPGSDKGHHRSLTPPLRLGDRKFLQSILRSGSPSPPLTPLAPAYSSQPGGGKGSGVFPASPICSPTTNKLTPRQERIARGYYAGHAHHSSISSDPAGRASPFLVPPSIPTAGSRSSLTSRHPDGQTQNRTSASSQGTGTSTAATAISTTSSSTLVGTGGHSPSSLRNEAHPPGTSINSSIQFHHPIPVHPVFEGRASPTSTARPEFPLRPTRPHETSREIADLLTAASSRGGSTGVLAARGQGRDRERERGTATPPPPSSSAAARRMLVPPPPLSPPPTRALPRPPSSASVAARGSPVPVGPSPLSVSEMSEMGKGLGRLDVSVEEGVGEGEPEGRV